MEKAQAVVGKRFICYGCNGYINNIDAHKGIEYTDKEKTIPICPECGLPMLKMCAQDHPCTCAATVHAGIMYCPECGDPVCPCNSHDVAPLSRVTGYIQDLNGFNASKRQEVKDRFRWNLGDA